MLGVSDGGRRAKRLPMAQSLRRSLLMAKPLGKQPMDHKSALQLTDCQIIFGPVLSAQKLVHMRRAKARASLAVSLMTTPSIMARSIRDGGCAKRRLSDNKCPVAKAMVASSLMMSSRGAVTGGTTLSQQLLALMALVVHITLQ